MHGLEALEKVEPIADPLEVFKTFTELWEREGMIAMFLEKTDLSPIGLDAPPFEADASSGANLAFAWDKPLRKADVVRHGFGALRLGRPSCRARP